MKPRFAHLRPDFDYSIEAQARALLCLEFLALVHEQNMTGVGAARMLAVSPSTMSGKNSLPTKFKTGGIRALMMKCQPPKTSGISAAAKSIRDRLSTIYSADALAALVGGQP